MINRFLPAFYQGSFETEQAAARATGLNLSQMSCSPLVLPEGGHLYVINEATFVVLPVPQHRFELWASSVEFACPTREDALQAIEEFEAVQGAGGWRVFERGAAGK